MDSCVPNFHSLLRLIVNPGEDITCQNALAFRVFDFDSAIAIHIALGFDVLEDFVKVRW